MAESHNVENWELYNCTTTVQFTWTSVVACVPSSAILYCTLLLYTHIVWIGIQIYTFCLTILISPSMGGGASYPHIPPSPHQESYAPPPPPGGELWYSTDQSFRDTKQNEWFPTLWLIIFPPVKGTVPSALYEKSFITQLKRLYYQLCMSNHLSPS